MMPADPNQGIAPPRKKPRGPDPYPVGNSAAAQKAAVEALERIQRSRPLKPPGKR